MAALVLAMQASAKKKQKMKIQDVLEKAVDGAMSGVSSVVSPLEKAVDGAKSMVAPTARAQVVP